MGKGIVVVFTLFVLLLVNGCGEPGEKEIMAMYGQGFKAIGAGGTNPNLPKEDFGEEYMVNYLCRLAAQQVVEPLKRENALRVLIYNPENAQTAYVTINNEKKTFSDAPEYIRTTLRNNGNRYKSVRIVFYSQTLCPEAEAFGQLVGKIAEEEKKAKMTIKLKQS